MKKRSQIRKYTVTKVSELLYEEQDPDTLKMLAEHVADKKKKLLEKKQSLNNQLNTVRKKSQKIAYQMVDNVKDRLEKRQKIIMDANSRPTAEDVKAVSDLFSYMENQTNIINRNSENIKQMNISIGQLLQAINFPTSDYTELDNEFQRLQKECAKEQAERNRLIAKRDENRRFYEQIQSTIEEYRIKWEKVQMQIREYQRELDHLVSYFKVRQEEDQDRIHRQKKLGINLQDQLIKAQEILNFNSEKNTMLLAKKIDVEERTER